MNTNREGDFQICISLSLNYIRICWSFFSIFYCNIKWKLITWTKKNLSPGKLNHIYKNLLKIFYRNNRFKRQTKKYNKSLKIWLCFQFSYQWRLKKLWIKYIFLNSSNKLPILASLFNLLVQLTRKTATGGVLVKNVIWGNSQKSQENTCGIVCSFHCKKRRNSMLEQSSGQLSWKKN